MTSESATPEASGTPAQTCARCGHQTGGCSRCGVTDDLLGGQIGSLRFCHVNSPSTPTCYTLASWEMTERGQAATPNEYVVSLPKLAPMDLIGKTVRWENDAVYSPLRWFDAFITGWDGDAYVGTVVNVGNYGDRLTVGDEAHNLKAHLCTVIDSEPVTEDEECE